MSHYMVTRLIRFSLRLREAAYFAEFFCRRYEALFIGDAATDFRLVDFRHGFGTVIRAGARRSGVGGGVAGHGIGGRGGGGGGRGGSRSRLERGFGKRLIA